MIETNDGGGEAVGEKGWDAADGAGLALGIVEGEVAFGGRVEFQNLRYGEAFLEGGPDVAAHAVAAAEAQVVIALAGALRGVQQEAAQLADILHQGAVPAGDVVPEPARGEAFAQDHRSARRQHGADRDHSADAVIHGQAVIKPVARAGRHHAGEPVAPHHHPMVADVGGLGQASGAGGVDQKGAVAEGQGAALRLVQRTAGQPVDRQVDAPVVGASLAMHPKGWRGLQRQDCLNRGRSKNSLCNNAAGLRYGQAVGQGRADKVGVDQGGRDADAAQPQPDGHVFRPVRHHQGDHIAVAQALAQGPTGIAAGAFRQLAIGEGPGV